MDYYFRELLKETIGASQDCFQTGFLLKISFS